MIDTPENCADCMCLYEFEFDGIPYEYESNANRKNLLINEIDIKKPDWCPLKSLSQKMAEENRWLSEDYAKGYNACINEILKGDVVE